MPERLQLRRALADVLPRPHGRVDLVPEAAPVVDRVGDVVVGEAEELVRLRVVRAPLRHLRHRPQLLRHLLDEVVHREDLLLERGRGIEELEEVVTALRRDLGRSRAEEQREVDVVDGHLDVVLLAPLLDVRVVEPLVVVGDEVRPLQDLQLPRELLPRIAQRPVDAERLVGQRAEHARGERGGAGLLQQVAAREPRARMLDPFCVGHRDLLSRLTVHRNAPPVKPLMKRSRNAL